MQALQAVTGLKPFRREGLGYRFEPPGVPAALIFSRLVERRDETTAEVQVIRPDGGHVLRRRINLLSSGRGSAAEFARELNEEVDIDWKRVLREGCESVLEAHRSGPELVTVEGDITPPPPPQWLCDGLLLKGKPNCWLAAASTGKALALDTPVPTPSGWTTMGQVREGDLVFDDQGRPTRVTDAWPVLDGRPCYQLTFSDGSSIIADADHLWTTATALERISLRRAERRDTSRARLTQLVPSLTGGQPYRSAALEAAQTQAVFAAYAGRTITQAALGKHLGVHEATIARLLHGATYRGVIQLNGLSQRDYRDQPYKHLSPQVHTTAEIATSLGRRNGASNHAVALGGALQLPEAKLCVDPYLLGAWLGDGTSDAGAITTGDAEIVDSIRLAGYEVRKQKAPLRYGVLGLLRQLRELGIVSGSPPHGRKYIPMRYLRASFEQRLALLQGLMDTDGYCPKQGTCEFSSTSASLTADVLELIRSLGICPQLRSKPCHGRTVRSSVVYTVAFSTSLPVFRLQRKLARQTTHPSPKNRWRYITDVHPVPSVPVRCIAVAAPSHQFLAGRSFIPTHNSTLAKAFCAYYAAGIRFCGRLTEQGAPLYLDWEDDEGSFRRVVHDVCRNLGVWPVPRMHWLDMHGRRFRDQIEHLGRLIDRCKIGFIVLDAVAAAGGSPGEHMSWEAIALDLEQALGQLPSVTVLGLDHVTSDEHKNGGVPVKARGAERKVEFFRNQWSLMLDRDALDRGRHLVGWTHTKVNAIVPTSPFVTELCHRDGELSILERGIEASPAMVERMTDMKRLLLQLEATPGVSVQEVCESVYGTIQRSKVETARTQLKRAQARGLAHVDNGGRWWAEVADSSPSNGLLKGPFRGHEELPW